MNKLVKGSLAAAAGITLLMGGAGSLALWNDSADLVGGSVATGELNIVSNGDGAWTNDIALWVPGDEDTYTETFTINAAGDNLSAELEALYSGVSANGVTADATVTIPGETAVAGVFTLDEGTYTATVTVDVSFDATGTDDQNETVPLGDVSVVLTQLP
jgi:alternate signal-mediated exported protein